MQIEDGRKTLRAQSLQILRDELIAGRLVPGQKVNEVQVAAEIGVSRGTLREAIRNLEQEGLLVSFPHRGTFVRRFTKEQAAELQEVRLSLEITAACRLARIWSPVAEQQLRASLRVLAHAYRTPLPFPERVRADLGFHESICAASGNAVLLDMWRSLTGNITVMVINVGNEHFTRLQQPNDHSPLIDAIASKDEATIREVFTAHFAEGQQVVADAIDASEAE